IGVNIERIHHILTSQILSGLCFDGHSEKEMTERCLDIPSKKEDMHLLRERAESISADFIAALPNLRSILATDVLASFNGDPAAESIDEVIYCYPGIRAISNYRIAHKLLELGVPMIPRMITEMAHSETGIDIHPGASIGTHFAIDHGTGVVIGATAIIGNNVKLYQGVTLGAKSFPLDELGHPIKGIPRHPVLEDNVIVYSNATILGRITIGENATVGGNIWVTEDVAPNARVIQSKAKK
ncbi:MAG: serine acetyltransferase, partial [Bacteroidales bacterium]|nr:serine acetyltransferase [Bacteroidales bacterium]